jgi:hypothetical protein
MPEPKDAIMRTQPIGTCSTITGNRPSLAGRSNAYYVDRRPIASETVMPGPIDIIVPILQKIQADVADIRRDVQRVDGKVDKLSARVDGLSDRIDGLSGRVDGLIIRMDHFEQDMAGIKVRLNGPGGPR